MGMEKSDDLKEVGKLKAFPDHPHDDAWYRARRFELQQQKVRLLGSQKPRVRMKLKKSA
jgi:hypothetical protein